MTGGTSDAPSTFAIGDIHGEAGLLRALLARLPLREADTLVILGDAIDRGPDSLVVVRHVLALREARTEGTVVLLRGNHEDAWMEAWDERAGCFGPAAPGVGPVSPVSPVGL